MLPDPQPRPFPLAATCGPKGRLFECRISRPGCSISSAETPRLARCLAVSGGRNHPVTMRCGALFTGETLALACYNMHLNGGELMIFFCRNYYTLSGLWQKPAFQHETSNSEERLFQEAGGTERGGFEPEADRAEAQWQAHR